MSEIVSAFGIDIRLLIIQAVNFGALLLVLWWFLYRPVIKMIETRRLKIEEGVRDAESAEKKLNEIEREKGSIMTAATKEAEDIVMNSKKVAEEKEKELLAEAYSKNERVLEEGRARAKEEARILIKESESEIAKMAVLGAEKILTKTSSASSSLGDGVPDKSDQSKTDLGKEKND